VLFAAACHAQPAPARHPVLRGRVSVAESTHAPAARRRGLLFMYWMTADEYRAAVDGTMGIRALLLVFERSRLVGRVDLSAPGASAPYELDVVPGDIVVSAVLDSTDELVDILIGVGGAGNLMADAKKPARVGASGGTADLALDQVKEARAPEGGCSGERLQVVTVNAPEVAGSIGNSTARQACVVLPPSYASAPARRYPVIYDFPGWGETGAGMLARFHHDQILDGAERAIGREAILVMVDTTTRLGSSYLVDSPVAGAWDTFLAARLIPIIDARFRTIAAPAGRATFGHSTGGYGAISFGFRHPELVGVVAAAAPDPLDMSAWVTGGPGGGPLPWFLGVLRAEDASGGAGFWASYAADWSPDPSARRGVAWPVDPATGRVRPAVLARWRAHSPQAWLADARRAAAIKAALDARIFLDAGEKDEFGLHGTTLAFSRALTRAGIAHRFATVPGGHMDRIPDLIGPPLRFCLDRLATAAP
jgi:enterochelin esterase-like enzyme